MYPLKDTSFAKSLSRNRFDILVFKDFANDVSFKGYTDETLLNEVDGMTDMLYEKQGSYLQGKDDERNEIAIAMLVEGDSIEKIARVTKLSENDVRKLQAETHNY